MKASPIELTIADRGLIAGILRLGLFETASLLLFIAYWAYETWNSAPCYFSLYPTYNHTAALLTGIFLLYLSLCLIQAIRLTMGARAREQMPFWQLVRRLYVSSSIRALPALMMLLSLAALPDFRVLYLLAALVLLPMRYLLAYRPHFVLAFPHVPTWPPGVAKRLIAAGLMLTGLSFFARLALPNFVSDCGSRAKLSTVKAQMHHFQTHLETSAAAKGIYPSSAQSLLAELRDSGHSERWAPSNPCTAESDLNSAVINLADAKLLQSNEFLGFRFDYPLTPSRCMVLYEAVSPHQYRIYGTDPKGSLIRDKGQNFMLTNE